MSKSITNKKGTAISVGSYSCETKVIRIESNDTYIDYEVDSTEDLDLLISKLRMLRDKFSLPEKYKSVIIELQ